VLNALARSVAISLFEDLRHSGAKTLIAIRNSFEGRPSPGSMTPMQSGPQEWLRPDGRIRYHSPGCKTIRKNCAGTDPHSRVRARRRFLGSLQWVRVPERSEAAPPGRRYRPTLARAHQNWRPQRRCSSAPADFRVLGVGRDPRSSKEKDPGGPYLGDGT